MKTTYTSLFTTLVTILISTAIPTTAQNSTAALPFASCLLPCDTTALAAVGCSATDFLCHCNQAPKTFSILVPCVLKNSTCGDSVLTDLSNFGAFAASTCVPYNISVPSISNYFPASTTVNGTTVTGGGNGTSSASGVATHSPTAVYTGGAVTAVGTSVKGVAALIAGVVVVAFAI